MMGRAHTFVYRATGGRVAGTAAGMPVLLLTTTGRRSGKARTTPLTFLWDKGDIVLIASFGGSELPPAWFLNLCDDPRVWVTIGRHRTGATARIAEDAERERLWPTITHTNPGYARYQQRAQRRIPVVLLTPRSSGRLGR
jgi:deazaflavin-dependent oxidoreductase (nitroreductase family)